jgi:hypothetical protein
MIGPLIMAICWIITYILIIRRSYIDQTYGMPYPVLYFNIAWEGMMLFFLFLGALFGTLYSYGPF